MITQPPKEICGKIYESGISQQCLLQQTRMKHLDKSRKEGNRVSGG